MNHNPVGITGPQSKCCHPAAIWLGTKQALSLMRKAPYSGGNGRCCSSKEAWASMERCDNKVSPGYLTWSLDNTRKMLSSRNTDFSEPCDCKLRRKANNASAVSKMPLGRPEGMTSHSKKSSHSSHPGFNF